MRLFPRKSQFHKSLLSATCFQTITAIFLCETIGLAQLANTDHLTSFRIANRPAEYPTIEIDLNLIGYNPAHDIAADTTSADMEGIVADDSVSNFVLSDPPTDLAPEYVPIAKHASPQFTPELVTNTSATRTAEPETTAPQIAASEITASPQISVPAAPADLEALEDFILLDEPLESTSDSTEAAAEPLPIESTDLEVATLEIDTPVNQSAQAPIANDTTAESAEPTNDVPPLEETEAPGTSHESTARPRPELTPQLISLGAEVRRCLLLYNQPYLNTGEHSCWSTLHAVLAQGPSAQIRIGSAEGRRVNAVQWLCSNNPCFNRQLFSIDKQGRLRGNVGPGFQGHEGQFLAVLAQTLVPRTQKIVAQGRQFTVDDLIRSEMATCRDNTELTFKLIALSQYLDSDTQWTNDIGETWDIPRLIKNELAQPINGAACGGTHRIMAISYAALKRNYRNEPMTGEWWRANKYMEDYHDYAVTLQNRDGSFSSDWFKERTDWGDMDRQLQTTGHILEWLVFTLPDEELYSESTLRSVMFLTNLMTQNRFHEWELGPRAHAYRALTVFYNRVFGEREPASHLAIRVTPVSPQANPERRSRATLFGRILGR
ncbi:MAG: hypothetical protein R3C28_29000 [Pirellulaceae bacterium]